MTAYDELKKRYDSVIEKLDKWEDKFPGQEAEEVAKQLETIKEKVTNANKEVREAKEKLSGVEGQIQEIERYKNELDETKRELEKLRNAPSKSTGIGVEVLDVYQEKINTLQNQVQEKESKIKELEKQSETKDRELEKEKTNKQLDVISAYQKASDVADNFEKLGADVGGRHFPVLGGPIGAILGGAAGMIGGGVFLGGYAVEKFADEGKDFYKITLESGTEVLINAGSGAMNIIKEGMKNDDEARKELKEFSENMAKAGLEGYGITADAAEKWRQGWENMANASMSVGADVYKATLLSTAGNLTELGKGALSVLEKGVEGGIEVETKYGVGAKIGGSGAAQANLKNKDETINDLRKQLEEKNERIKKLEENQEKLTAQIVQVALNK